MDLLEKIKDSCPRSRVLMGMDIGKKTIGIALSDSSHSIATPLTTITRKKFRQDLRALEDIIRDYQVGGYVIGYPLNMDGSAGPKCQSVRDFAMEFEAQLSDEFKTDGAVWVALKDERLSTSCVEGVIAADFDISRRKAKDRGLIDKLAAQVILQGALDLMMGGGN
ncbi:MAG: Holliday junction resolvase RuvX [Alphaproteobacteria bacterium]